MKTKNAIILSIFVTVLFTGCTVRQHYRTLSFFFDGVPDPAIQDSLARALVIDSVATFRNDTASKETLALVTLTTVHPPYKERDCGICHDQGRMGKLNSSVPELCYSCHQEKRAAFEYQHGPASGRYCTSCHDPHKSDGPALLRYMGNDLCFHCHDQGRVISRSVHKNREDRACISCHDPHGGTNRYYLK